MLSIKIHIKLDQKLNKLRVNIYNKFKKKINLDFEVTNETLNFDEMLLRLEKEASNHKITQIEWPKDDTIFTIVTIPNFKDIGNKILKNIDILLIDPTEIIDSFEKKEKIMKIYHCDPLSLWT